MPKLIVMKKVKRDPMPVDMELASFIREWNDPITIRYGRGEDMPTFNPAESALTGGYLRIQQLLKASGLDLSDEQNGNNPDMPNPSQGFMDDIYHKKPLDFF
jgi:hypothetical protein